MGLYSHSASITAGTELRSLLIESHTLIVVVEDYDPTRIRRSAFVRLSFAKRDSNSALHPIANHAFSVLADRFEQEFEIVE